MYATRSGPKQRRFLDRFHYTREGDRETGEYDRRPRRGGIAKEDAGGKHKGESTKKRAESRDQMFSILTPSAILIGG
jgi:transposase